MRQILIFMVFSWKGTPAVKVWKDGSKSSAKVVTGNAEAISAENWQGKSYSAANKVNIADYFEENTQYHYQYTDNYTGDDSVWSAEYDYTTKATDKFRLFLPVTLRLVLQEAVQINQLMMPVLQEMHTTGIRQCSRH